MKDYKIVAINLGSTSTKIAYYENEKCIFKDDIPHSASDLEPFKTIWEQIDYRKERIEKFFDENGIVITDLDAMVTRGGHTEPITGGLYLVTDKMLEQSRSEKYGNHPTDLGLQLVKEFSKSGLKPFTVDTPSTDEFEDLARYTGLPQMKRRSSFHILNHRAAGKQCAKDMGKDYNTLNFVGVHMGGGISIAAHKKGKLIDGNNALDGDGPFSTNRTGGLPVGELIKLCFSGEHTQSEVKKMINGKGGLMAYIGENDVKTIEAKAQSGDAHCKEVLDAMCYQIAKEVGAYATVLKGDVDSIFFTGGIAHSQYITKTISESVSFIAPIKLYPGEYEMQSLALTTLVGLRGEEPIHQLT